MDKTIGREFIGREFKCINQTLLKKSCTELKLAQLSNSEDAIKLTKKALEEAHKNSLGVRVKQAKML